VPDDLMSNAEIGQDICCRTRSAMVNRRISLESPDWRVEREGKLAVPI
jgi:hypothetical protein